MDIGQHKLRMQFKAEINLDASEDSFAEYVNWLEKLRANEINKEILTENEHLKDIMQKAMDILDDGISAIPR